MTQEQKDLLLKDICARLPYKVKASYYGAEEEREIWDEIEGVTLDGYVDIGQYGLPIESVKPYLFPFSSMTEEQLFEVRQILGKDWEIEKDFIHLNTAYVVSRTLSYLELQALFEWFNKNHIDYRGLIEKGFAIDATGKNIY